MLTVAFLKSRRPGTQKEIGKANTQILNRGKNTGRGTKKQGGGNGMKREKAENWFNENPHTGGGTKKRGKKWDEKREGGKPVQRAPAYRRWDKGTGKTNGMKREKVENRFSENPRAGGGSTAIAD